jgi:hypothetical protein
MPGYSRLFEVDRLQSALTRRFLIPVLPALEEFFLALRAESDKALAPGAGKIYGKPYPYGFCLEITLDVIDRIRVRERWPGGRGARALAAFLRHGGRLTRVWGVLRDSFFQNAIQLGSLYVDVSNDTVDVRKPKVEILPFGDSGLVSVRDGDHFARIGRRYWRTRFYANTALPSLAPVFPMIGVSPAGRVSLHSNLTHMVRLFSADGFRLAEAWLRDGPLPPNQAVRALRAACPQDILKGDPDVGLEASLEACRRERAVRRSRAEASLLRLRALFDRVPQGQIPVSDPVAFNVNILNKHRANARSSAGVWQYYSFEFNEMVSRSM